MTDFSIVYVPVGVGTFHMETAGQAFRDTCALLRSLAEEAGLQEGTLKIPEAILFSSAEVDAWMSDKDSSLVILQNVTFANAGYTEKLLAHTKAPVLIWTLRDPAADGGRLKLNALTGAFAAANRLYMDGEVLYRHVMGNPSEPDIRRTLRAYMRAWACRQQIEGTKILRVGEPPEGFSFGEIEETALKTQFGMTLQKTPLEEMFARAKAIPENALAGYLAEAAEKLPGFTALPEQNQKGYAALMKAYRDYADAENIAALSSRCESDTLGAVTMLLAAKLSGKAVFFGDPSAVDEREGTITFWHCGMAAPSLACEEEGPAVGVHCNRGIGPTMEFGCRGSERVSILRIGKEKDGTLRLFTAGGEALERPRQYHGTSLVVKPDRPAAQLVHTAVEDGWEPHFVIAMDDIVEEMQLLAMLCGVGCWPY